MEIEGVKLKQKRKVDNLREAEDNAVGKKVWESLWPNIYQLWLLSSTIKSNKYPKLELPGAWESPNSSCP